MLEKEVAERARLEREVIESCAREQRRIAYDLHDGVGQQLLGIALSAKLLEEQMRSDRPAEAEKASAIVQLANEAARQTRLTARTLEGADGVGRFENGLGVALHEYQSKLPGQKRGQSQRHFVAD